MDSGVTLRRPPAMDSASLRDLLNLHNDDNQTLTLAAVLGAPPPSPARTLLDAIRDEDEAGGVGRGGGSWKGLRERIRRAGGPSGGIAATGGREVGRAEVATAAERNEPIRVSLMTLLEQTDRMGNTSDNLRGTATLAAAMMGMMSEEDEAEEVYNDDNTYVCCVCTVRHKGAAFIPCGHTFCRMCSRELWVSRGSCPLCNSFILEILDIF